ncbi:Peptidase S24/S26A/S26B/S26C family protein [Euphorbia peplus]|nr:Peptidase S24/S26A/S26B/S26C family protein [Euphorbia peplus]
MLPTINITGDISLADRISLRTGKVGTGDIVLVCSPLDPKIIPVKRVKGVEGDSVTYLIDPKNNHEIATSSFPSLLVSVLLVELTGGGSGIGD